MGRVITQTCNRTFQTVNGAFEVLRENQKFGLEFEMLGGVFNPIQNRGGGEQKGPPTSFSPVTSRKVGTSLQNFLAFSFNLLSTLM